MSEVALPFPIHALCSRAQSEESPQRRHQVALFAWEASIRLLVASDPPEDPKDLADKPTLGTWVNSARPREAVVLSSTEVLAVYQLLRKVGFGEDKRPQRVSPVELLRSLPRYRNEDVHSLLALGTRFYENAADTLIAGLRAFWASGGIWPVDARLLYVQHVRKIGTGEYTARVASLMGPDPEFGSRVLTAEQENQTNPSRVYLYMGSAYKALHPWVVFRPPQGFYFYDNSGGRRAEFQDFANSRKTKAAELDLDDALPDLGLSESLRKVFQLERDSVERVPPVEACAAALQGADGPTFVEDEYMGRYHPSLSCNRVRQWTDLKGLVESRNDQIIVVSGARQEAVEQFATRIRCELKTTAPSRTVEVKWALSPWRSAPFPDTPREYREALTRALEESSPVKGLQSALQFHLERHHLVLLHPLVWRGFGDESLVMYYTEWLPQTLADLGHHRTWALKCIQPVAWDSTWLRGFLERRRARRMLSILRRRSRDPHVQVLDELRPISREEVWEFCDSRGLSGDAVKVVVERVTRRSANSAQILQNLRNYLDREACLR
jgi:hypothetical protein